MQRSYSYLERSGEEHIYYNVSIPYDFTSTNYLTPATFVENRTQPIIDNPNDYYLSIIRFYIPSFMLPVTSLPILPFPNTNVNKTSLSIIFSYNGIYSDEQSLIYFTEDDTTTAPPSATATNPTYPTNNPYYFIYNYQHYLNIINNGFLAALTNLQTKPGTGAISAATSPFITYDAVTQLLTLHASSTFYDQANLSLPIILYFNVPTYDFLTGFPYLNTTLNLFNPTVPGGTRNTLQLLLQDDGVNTVGGVINLTEEYITVGSINLFKSIIITSNSIPIQSELLPASNGSGINIGKPIATDFEPLINDSAGQARSVFQYYPQGPYRLINLNSASPLYKVDINVFWQDIYGNVYPFYVAYDSIITIKLLFVRKTVYNSGINKK